MTENTTTEILCCRWSPTIGALEDTHQRVWGTKDYQPFGLSIGDMVIAEHDQQKPTVFFGLYGIPDFMALWGHKGKRYILWAGSDIQHFLQGYFLDPEGKIRIHPTQLAPWIDSCCESFVENDIEKAALASVGIRAKVVPSFLGDVSTYPQSYQHSVRPKLYTSVSGDNFKLYGWDKIAKLARNNPGVEFHLYGNTKPFGYFKDEDGEWLVKDRTLTNIIDHGRVPKEQMNEEISHMQGALRLTEFDGFSEIIAKAILMRQYAVSVIEYPKEWGVLSVEEIGKIKGLTEPNNEGRKELLKVLNRYPWNRNA